MKQVICTNRRKDAKLTAQRQAAEQRKMGLRFSGSINLNLNIMEMLRNLQRSAWVARGLQSRNFGIGDTTSIHCYVSADLLEQSRIIKQRETVILLHGFGSDSLSGWTIFQIKALTPYFNLIVPDLIYFGSSFSSSDACKSELFQADCIKKLLDLLAVNSVYVVGHSYGGMVAFWMAHRYPDLVKKVVIVSSGICRDTPSANAKVAAECGVSNIQEILVPTNVEGFYKGMAFIVAMKTPRWIPWFLWRQCFKIMDSNREQRTQLLKHMVTGNEKGKPVPLLQQEVLLMWGEHDRIFPVEEAYSLHRHLGQKSELLVLEGCGHVPQLEKPCQFNTVLLSFLL